MSQESKGASDVASHPQPVPRTSWSAVIALGVAVFMAAIDLTIVAVALPAMGASLSVGPARAQWVILAYALPMIALLLPAGRWVDGVNRRSAFVVAVVGFAGASALAGAAPTFQLLLAARPLQGRFGALISALVLAIAAAAAHPSQRGRAKGVITTLGPLGSVAGPGLGGLLVAGPRWRWILYLNLPASCWTACSGSPLPRRAPYRWRCRWRWRWPPSSVATRPTWSAAGRHHDRRRADPGRWPAIDPPGPPLGWPGRGLAAGVARAGRNDEPDDGVFDEVASPEPSLVAKPDLPNDVAHHDEERY
jgi:MFS family permease